MLSTSRSLSAVQNPISSVLPHKSISAHSRKTISTLSKRFGLAAASQIPLHYLLSAKNPWNPIQHLTRLSHEELNPYHRYLSFVLLTLFTLHPTLYLSLFTQRPLLCKRIHDRAVLLALTSLLTLGTTALPQPATSPTGSSTPRTLS